VGVLFVLTPSPFRIPFNISVFGHFERGDDDLNEIFFSIFFQIFKKNEIEKSI
jgi:hypothetical protein